MKRALITGIAGFAGSHLAAHLLESGWEVAGLEQPGASLGNLAGMGERATLAECDILDAGGVERVVRDSAPAAVFHLAAVSFVPDAEKRSGTALDANVKGTLNVLEACRAAAPGARLLFISSAEVYGKVAPGDMPITERRSPAPASFYALTKRCAEELVLYYHRAHSLPAVILRAFNHIGPRQSRSFVTASFASQIAEIEAGKRPPVLDVGNLEASRDFSDVRDTVRAYRLAAEKCAAGETYNICSGRAHAVRDILDLLLRMSTARITIRQDPGRMRKSDVPVFYGDCSLFRRATGWAPEHGIESTLAATLEYWRGKV